MSVGQQIHDAAVVEIENFRMPEMLFIGIDKYRELVGECSYPLGPSPYFSSPAGSLKIEVVYDDPYTICVCENHLMHMLQKLGVRH